MKYKITEEVHTLKFFKPIFDFSEDIKIIGDLDIEPFNVFSTEFSGVYWYLKYSVLRYKDIKINKDEIQYDYKVFFNEQNLNFIYFTFYDEANYKLYCIDGSFYVDVFNKSIDFVIKNNYSYTHA